MYWLHLQQIILCPVFHTVSQSVQKPSQESVTFHFVHDSLTVPSSSLLAAVCCKWAGNDFSGKHLSVVHQEVGWGQWQWLINFIVNKDQRPRIKNWLNLQSLYSSYNALVKLFQEHISSIPLQKPLPEFAYQASHSTMNLQVIPFSQRNSNGCEALMSFHQFAFHCFLINSL